MTTLNATIHIPEDVMFRDLGGEAVILNLTTGKYYGLDDVGTRMWALLAEHGRIELVFQSLLKEYDVDGDRLQQDLFALVDRLAADDLLKVEDAA
jgi:hypothetical protein